MSGPETRYCGYCRNFRPDEGFKTVPHLGSGTVRGMCLKCQEVRKKPREELEALAAKAKIDRTRR